MLLSEIIVIAFGLALDAFAVSLGAGAVGSLRRSLVAITAPPRVSLRTLPCLLPPERSTSDSLGTASRDST